MTSEVTQTEPWPGCYADLQRRRVVTLATLGLMLSKMAGGEAAEVVGYDAADLYAEVLMALAIEDADDTDIALEIARDEPDGDILTRLTAQSGEGRSGAGEDAALKLVAGYVDYTTESKDRWEQGKAAGYRELGSIVAAALRATDDAGES